MAGLMGKIGDALHIGGNKTEEQKHAEAHKTDQHVVKPHGEGAQKEGFMEKIKDKISGDKEGGEHKKEGGEKKKKKDKKKKGEGHGHGDSSSSSDSD